MGGAFPDDAAGFTVEAEELPGLFGVVVGGVAGAVEADFERGVAFGADGGGDIETVVPEDGTGVAEAGDVGAPEDGFQGSGGGVGVEVEGGGLGGDAGGLSAAVGGPVFGLEEGTDEEEERAAHGESVAEGHL